jgi:hypothetical protein
LNIKTNGNVLAGKFQTVLERLPGELLDVAWATRVPPVTGTYVPLVCEKIYDETWPDKGVHNIHTSHNARVL